MIAWTWVHAIVAVLIASDVWWAATHPAQVRNVWDIVPRGRNREGNHASIVGRCNAFALLPSLSYQGPTIPVGPPPTSLPVTWRPTRAPTWTRVVAWPPTTWPRHYAPPAPMRGHPGSATWPQCRVAPSRWSRAPRVSSPPTPFATSAPTGK